MYCSQCGKELPDENNFCSKCGANLREHKISPEVSYGSYLAIAGWITVISGAILSLIIISMNKELIWTAVVIFVSTFLYALFYFGLHKTLLKIERIEEALGISSYEWAVNPKEEKMPVGSDSTIKKSGENSEDLPWELREES
jgi:uncharacterized membrane protein YvbJ